MQFCRSTCPVATSPQVAKNGKARPTDCGSDPGNPIFRELENWMLSLRLQTVHCGDVVSVCF